MHSDFWSFSKPEASSALEEEQFGRADENELRASVHAWNRARGHQRRHGRRPAWSPRLRGTVTGLVAVQPG